MPKRKAKCISHILRNHRLQAAFEQRSKILSFATSSSNVFLPSCALNIRSLSSTAASPDAHRNLSISRYRGVHAILSVVFCTLNTPRCGLLQTTQQYLPLKALQQHPISKSSSLSPSTVGHCGTQTIMQLDTRRYQVSVCPAALLVEIILYRYMLRFENLPQFLLSNQPTSPPL